MFLVTSIPTDVEQNGSVVIQTKPDETDICNSNTQLNEVFPSFIHFYDFQKLLRIDAQL